MMERIAFCPRCGTKLQDDAVFCGSCGRRAAAGEPQKAPVVAPKASSSKLLIWLALILLVSYFGLSSLLPHRWQRSDAGASTSSETAALPASLPALLMSHHEQKLFTGSVAVNPRSFRWVTFTIDPRMKNIHVAGHFQAFGGGQNDIQTVICSEEDFINFKNGHQARVFYNSNKTTVGDIDAPIPSVEGKYVLAFNNAFSVLSAKTVSGEVTLSYDSF